MGDKVVILWSRKLKSVFGRKKTQTVRSSLGKKMRDERERERERTIEREEYDAENEKITRERAQWFLNARWIHLRRR